MTDQKEIYDLIKRSRELGAIIRNYNMPPYDEQGNGIITKVQVRSGIKGVGRDWMPTGLAAEVLRKFLFESHLEVASKTVSEWPDWKKNVLGGTSQ